MVIGAAAKRVSLPENQQGASAASRGALMTVLP
jgi:hypothetical protein